MLLKAFVISAKANELRVYSQLLTVKKTKYFTAIQVLFPGIYTLKYDWDTRIGAGTLLTAKAMRIVTDHKIPALTAAPIAVLLNFYGKIISRLGFKHSKFERGGD
jgi:hypothetical protein